MFLLRTPEDWSGHVDDGPVSFKLKGKDFRYFSRVGQPVYRFTMYPTDEEFRDHVGTAWGEIKRDALKTQKHSRQPASQPP